MTMVLDVMVNGRKKRKVEPARFGGDLLGEQREHHKKEHHRGELAWTGKLMIAINLIHGGHYYFATGVLRDDESNVNFA